MGSLRNGIEHLSLAVNGKVVASTMVIRFPLYQALGLLAQLVGQMPLEVSCAAVVGVSLTARVTRRTSDKAEA